MGRVTKLWLLLPRQIRRFPPDLAGVVGLVVAAISVASVPGVQGSVLRVLFGAPFVLFAPGYAITAAAFPERKESGEREDRSNAGFLVRSRDGLTLSERLLFSTGLSVFIVPLLALGLNFTPWGIRFATLASLIGGFTVAMALLAAVRRWQLPSERRIRIPRREWYRAVRSELFAPTSRLEAGLNAVLLLSTLIAVGSGAYAVLGPQESQSFTKFYLLGVNESGELVADDYPTAVVEGRNSTFVVGISNHEHRSVEYSVVIRLQRLQFEDGAAVVTESQRVDQFRANVDANETVHRRHTVPLQLDGERLRLQYLLYVGDPPANPTAENAYRSVHHWLNVTTQ